MATSSLRPGMGAIPYNHEASSGVTFRVWVKFASEVYIAGTFNSWSADIDKAEINHK